jgi:hypothetical protein
MLVVNWIQDFFNPPPPPATPAKKEETVETENVESVSDKVKTD